MANKASKLAPRFHLFLLFSFLLAYFFPPLGGLDLIIMPGLGFTPEGHRLGRGKGYYDSYLKKCAVLPSGQPYTIALAFREQMCDHIPVSEHDMTVDEVLFVEK